MTHPILFLWLLVANLDLHACGQGIPDQENSSTSENQKAASFLNNWSFAFSLYIQLVISNPGTNVLFSPLSFSIPLTLLALQAKPEARDHTLQSLGYFTTAPKAQAHTHYSQLLQALLPRPGKCQVDTGSVLFVNSYQNLEQKFVQTAQSLYHTEVFLASLGNTQRVKQQVEAALQEKTHGKIKNLLLDLESHSVMILANYIFFKGNWKYRFDPKLTEIRPFWVSEELTIQVPTMQRLGWFQLQHRSSLHSHILRLPYACRLTAVFILPDVGRTREVEEVLMEEKFDTWTRPFPPSRRKLYFPKFSFLGRTQLEQGALLANSVDLFSYRTGLSGITAQATPMKVSRAEHRAELTVDEGGEEEEDIKDLGSFPRQFIPAFHFNRPFLLLIIEEVSHNLLFMGKVVNPNVTL
ncbi:alpha-1-antitrypsin-like [Dipodomys merriami]|uniref:alpha-1-antitrypsin-like n=1 Tax=Dipodomys merriami TaxID=94247 RepID=UPI003855F752